MSGCHLLYVRLGCQQFPNPWIVDSRVHHQNICNHRWIHKRVQVLGLYLHFQQHWRCDPWSKLSMSKCHMVLVFLATFTLKAKTTLPASLLVFDRYESSKFSIWCTSNSCVIDLLSNTAQSLHRGIGSHHWALGRLMSISRCCATSMLLLILSLHRLKPM